MNGADFESADLARRQGDDAFDRKAWQLAASRYWHCEEVLEKTWQANFELDRRILQLGQDVPQHLCYCLAQEGRFEDAVLALENGIARYLNRLVRVKELGWKSSDDGSFSYRPTDDARVLSYVTAVEKLIENLSRNTHRSTRDDLPHALQIKVAISHRVSESNQRELAIIEEELLSYSRAEQSPVLEAAIHILTGHKQLSVADRNNQTLCKAVQLLVKQAQILRKYDFSDIDDSTQHEVENAQKEISRYAADLPPGWSRTSWEDIEAGQGTSTDKGGAFGDHAALPYIYLVTTAHGSLSLTVLPDPAISAEKFTTTSCRT